MAPLAVPLLGGVLVAMAAWMLIRAWDSTFGDWFERLAKAMEAVSVPIPRIGGHPLRGLATALRNLASDWRHGLGLMAMAVTGPLVVLLVAVAKLLWYPVRETRALAADVGDALWSLRHTVVPAMIAAKVAWIPRHLVALEREVASLAHRAPIHITKDITNYAKGAFTTVVEPIAKLPWPRLGRAERELDAVWKRLRKLERHVPAALTAAALTAIVARTSFRWVRCSRVRRVGKAVCGMDESVLDDLLTAALLVVGTVNLVQLARELEPIVDDSTAAVLHFWTADK